MTSITIVMAVGFQAYVSSATPATPEVTFVDLSGRLLAGEDGWGSGDEVVRITHNGGDPLMEATTSILITVDETTRLYAGAGLASAFADGVHTIGERWETPTGDLTIDQGDTAYVEVVAGDQSSAVVASLELDARGTAP